MIKLEAKGGSLSAISEIRVQSSSAEPSLSLSAEGVRSQVNGQWQDDPAHMRQVLSFFGADGAVEIEGKVPEVCAVEVASAWAVVAEVQLSAKALPAFQAGRVSRSLVALDLVRVVEVWAAPGKLLWQASDRANGAAKGGRVMDETGKVKAA